MGYEQAEDRSDAPRCRYGNVFGSHSAGSPSRNLPAPWPYASAGRIVGAKNESWAGVAYALSRGKRGLRKGTTLGQLLRRERGVFCRRAALCNVRFRRIVPLNASRYDDSHQPEWRNGRRSGFKIRSGHV